MKELEGKLKQLAEAFEKELQQAETPADLEQVRVRYLGRKGKLAELVKLLPTLPEQDRPAFGRAVNKLKSDVRRTYQDKAARIKGRAAEAPPRARLDVTQPGVRPRIGHAHLITQTLEAITSIFARMGFEVAYGPEVELEYYNFDALNIAADHPDRDPYDTFYLQDDVLLRSHTSPVQIRVMESCQPPVRIVVPGRVYRPDTVDASHSFMFHQVEGLLVDEGVNFADLKAVLTMFARQFYGEQVRTRFRPSFFPFTEPSADMDIFCSLCQGKGCPACKGQGWIEVLGSGMVDPAVFEAVGYDNEKYTGFAFGMGVERLAMLRFGVTDIRLFFENDLRFVNQF